MSRGTGSWARASAVVFTAAVLVTGLVLAQHLARPPGRKLSDLAPPPGGYVTRLAPVDAYAALPGDALAAAQVVASSWEPRPGNERYNHTTPGHIALRPVVAAAKAYDPRWDKYILSRVTGHFSGTTDEIFQWAAAKWGLPDNIFRVVAYMESDWFQDNHGDFVHSRAQCPPGYTTMPCPVTFGVVGVKSTNWPGIFPWNRDSTAADVDVLGGWLRGCYEGWVWWLRDHGNRSRGGYHAGDLWGCVGAWYSGDWHDGLANQRGGENYLLRAQHWWRARPWLRRGFRRTR